MTMVAQHVDADMSRLWRGFCAGDGRSRDRILSLHYEEFRRIARSVLSGDGAKLQIQPTDPRPRGHDPHHAGWTRSPGATGRTCFPCPARVMRQVLIDEVRRFRASKRQAPPVETLWAEPDVHARRTCDIEAFDEALTRLGEIDPAKAKIVEQRFYAGLTMEEVASVSGVSESTVKRQWRVARAWLLNELTAD